MKNFIHFKNIEFSYTKTNKVFDGLNLQIAKWQQVGIVGHSGAGKSTIVNLLLKNPLIFKCSIKDQSNRVSSPKVH